MIATQRVCRVQIKRAYASLAPNLYGQPHATSHPHLFGSSDELTPGITKKEYHERRKRLMNSLPEGSIAILRAGSVKYMTKNIFYRFRQASDFWYLTGFEEPDSAVILEKDLSPKGYRMSFFCAPRDAKKELWDGPITGLNGAKEVFGADASFEIGKLLDKLSALLPTSSHVYADVTHAPRRSSRKNLMSYLNSASSYSLTPPKTPYPTNPLSDLDPFLHGLGSSKLKSLSELVAKLRSIKSPAERRLMKGAAVRSARAHAMTMQFSRSGMSEADLEAHFQYICALSYDGNDGIGNSGCQRPAYVPVVASGKNALTIHHTTNNQTIRDGELLLLDGGGEWNGYASDITRTFPVSGTFTPAQRALYQAVLNVQKQCVSLICTGSLGPTLASRSPTGGEATNLSLMDLHRTSVRLLGDELEKIGFKFDSWGRGVEEKLYPHLLGHAVGIDLHESNGSYDEPLRAGQIITIEPGVYVPEDGRYPREFHGLGVRIEDEVLLEEDHGTVLSIDAPKEIADVEATCQGLVQIR